MELVVNFFLLVTVVSSISVAKSNDSIQPTSKNNRLAHTDEAHGNAVNMNDISMILERIGDLEMLEERHKINEMENNINIQKLEKELGIQGGTIRDLKAINERQANEIRTLKETFERKDKDDTFAEISNAGLSVEPDILGRTQKSIGGAHVAFFAKLDGNLAHLAPNATVAFDVVGTNVGGAYDPKTGYFIAPVPGIYLFSTTLTTFSVFQINCGIAINGDRYTHLWINGADGAFGSSGQTVLLDLKTGDRVTVQQGDAEAYVDGGGHSLFMGFLLM